MWGMTDSINTTGPTIERVQVTHLPGRYGGRITHPWKWELTTPDGEIRYFDTKRDALAWWDENEPATYPDVFEAAEAAQAMADELGEACYVRKERAKLDDPHGHLAHARYLGADAALAAASWLTMSEADARSILDDVDPEVMDRHPEPNLSGEFADDPTPRTLAREVIGAHSDDGDSCLFDELEDAIATAWEDGRDAVWSDALEATALRALGDVARALEVEAANEATVASYRKAAGL